MVSKSAAEHLINEWMRSLMLENTLTALCRIDFESVRLPFTQEVLNMENT
jgi:hypothetical protein